MCQKHGPAGKNISSPISRNLRQTFNTSKEIKPVADSLSRATTDLVHLGIDYSPMTADEENNPEGQECRSPSSSIMLQDIPFGQGVTLLCDVSTGQTGLVVPVNWRHQVSMVYLIPPYVTHGNWYLQDLSLKTYIHKGEIG